MLIKTVLPFSSAVQRGVCRFSGFRLAALRWFAVFLASSACAVSATSYRFASIAPPRWRRAFSRFAPIVKWGLPVLASGSNRAVKPTRLRRAAYFRALAPLKTNLFCPCLFKRDSISQALFSAGFVVSPGFACWCYAGLWSFWALALA